MGKLIWCTGQLVKTVKIWLKPMLDGDNNETSMDMQTYKQRFFVVNACTMCWKEKYSSLSSSIS